MFQPGRLTSEEEVYCLALIAFITGFGFFSEQLKKNKFLKDPEKWVFIFLIFLFSHNFTCFMSPMKLYTFISAKQFSRIYIKFLVNNTKNT